MKIVKTLLIVVLNIKSIMIFSQIQNSINEYPLNTISDYITNGSYVKDTFNQLDKYVGTWEGTLNNKKFTLVVEKRINHPFNYLDKSYFKDCLVAKYEWVNLIDNSIISNTLNAVNYNDFKIENSGGPYNDELNFIFCDGLCKNCIEIYTRISNNDTSLKFIAFYSTATEGFDPTDCPYTRKVDIPVPIPMNGITLNKL